MKFKYIFVVLFACVVINSSFAGWSKTESCNHDGPISDCSGPDPDIEWLYNGWETGMVASAEIKHTHETTLMQAPIYQTYKHKITYKSSEPTPTDCPIFDLVVGGRTVGTATPESLYATQAHCGTKKTGDTSLAIEDSSIIVTGDPFELDDQRGEAKSYWYAELKNNTNPGSKAETTGGSVHYQASPDKYVWDMTINWLLSPFTTKSNPATAIGKNAVQSGSTEIEVDMTVNYSLIESSKRVQKVWGKVTQKINNNLTGQAGSSTGEVTGKVQSKLDIDQFDLTKTY